MKKKLPLAIVILSLSILAVVSARVHNVAAQEAAGGVGGQGGVGGAGGSGGRGGAGGGYGGSGGSGSIAAFGEWVFVFNNGTLYKLAAHDLTLSKKTNLNELNVERRNRRGANQRGADGESGESGAGGSGGAGGAGGAGGGSILAAGGLGQTEDVAAHGEFVYVLRADTVHKLTADDLKAVKSTHLE